MRLCSQPEAQLSPSSTVFKVHLQSPKRKTPMLPPDDSRQGRRPRDEQMHFEGASLAIIQRLAFVLLNVGGQGIRGCVLAGPDYLIRVVEGMLLQSPAVRGTGHFCLNDFFLSSFPSSVLLLLCLLPSLPGKTSWSSVCQAPCPPLPLPPPHVHSDAVPDACSAGKAGTPPCPLPTGAGMQQAVSLCLSLLGRQDQRRGENLLV